MKKKMFKYFVVNFIALGISTNIHATTNAELADKYYQAFNAPNDGTGRDIMFGHFYNEVSVASQAEILAEILDRASSITPPAKNVIIDVVIFLRGVGHDLAWNEHLEKSIYAQAQNSDPFIHELLITLLAQQQTVKARNFVLSFQNDPDEEVRYEVFHSIFRWPDAEAIYQKFIQDHQSDPKYAKTVQAAQNQLNSLHEFQKANGK